MGWVQSNGFLCCDSCGEPSATSCEKFYAFRAGDRQPIYYFCKSCVNKYVAKNSDLTNIRILDVGRVRSGEALYQRFENAEGDKIRVVGVGKERDTDSPTDTLTNETIMKALDGAY